MAIYVKSHMRGGSAVRAYTRGGKIKSLRKEYRRLETATYKWGVRLDKRGRGRWSSSVYNKLKTARDSKMRELQRAQGFKVW